MQQRTDSRRESERRYKAAHYKRVPLDVKPEEHRMIKEAAAAAGIGVNTWIKRAIAAQLGNADKEEDAGEGQTA